ncbi:MAG: hypothetical protein ABI980_16210 [Nitrospirota bacterium]
MTRLQIAAIAHAFTKRTDTQTAPYPIQDGQILRFQMQWNS